METAIFSVAKETEHGDTVPSTNAFDFTLDSWEFLRIGHESQGKTLATGLSKIHSDTFNKQVRS